MVTRTNLITNPSFETNTTGWAQVSASHTITRQTSGGYAGSSFLRCVTPNINNPEGVSYGSNVATSVAAVQGNTVVVQARLKGSGTVYLRFVERTAAFGGLGNAPNVQTITLNGSWTEYSRAYTVVSATAVCVQVQVVTASQQAATIDVDAVMVQLASATSDYFDGSYPNAAWTGTAHASTSILTIPDVSTVLRLGTSYVGPLRVG